MPTPDTNIASENRAPEPQKPTDLQQHITRAQSIHSQLSELQRRLATINYRLQPSLQVEGAPTEEPERQSGDMPALQWALTDIEQTIATMQGYINQLESLV